MKFMHLSDLHLGKKINNFPMIKDQEYILSQIIDLIKNEKPDGVFIAGDIYDKPLPPAEAVSLMDSFLTELSSMEIQTFVISGNHDSAERLSFGSRIMEAKGIFLSRVFDGCLEPISLEDNYGKINIYMLPFVKPLNIRPFFEDIEISTYEDGIRAIIENTDIDTKQRNILLCHQFILNGQVCESEEKSIGGIDEISADIFDNFDYVALGHLHGPQRIGKETIRYCGTPLKYSFSEKNHKKSVTIVEFLEKGNITIKTIPLVPLKDMRELKGSFGEIVEIGKKDNNSDDYMRIILTDEEEIIEGISKLRYYYPNIMKLEYDNKRTRANQAFTLEPSHNKISPVEMFNDFYKKQNNHEMSEEQENLIRGIIETIWEGEK